eukprot:3690425-Amphidinium_carterae.1
MVDAEKARLDGSARLRAQPSFTALAQIYHIILVALHPCDTSVHETITMEDIDSSDCFWRTNLAI